MPLSQNNKNLPYVVAKIAQTIDGKIATSAGKSKWITSEKARQFSRNKRKNFDAILVGINTVLKDNPQLNAPGKKNFTKIILDSSLKISLSANIFKDVAARYCVIAVTKKAPASKIKQFIHKGINIIVCPKIKNQINLIWLFKRLYKCDIKKILIEGGARTIGSALKQNLINEFNIYVAPKLMGDGQALSSVVGLPCKDIQKAVQLRNLVVKKIGEDLFIKAYVYRNH